MGYGARARGASHREDGALPRPAGQQAVGRRVCRHLCHETGMRQAAPVFLIASGAALIVSGFAWDLAFAGLPYQDPTPEMQERWLFHKGVADRIMAAGAAVLGIGCLWQAGRWTLRLLAGRRPD